MFNELEPANVYELNRACHLSFHLFFGNEVEAENRYICLEQNDRMNLNCPGCPFSYEKGGNYEPKKIE